MRHQVYGTGFDVEAEVVETLHKHTVHRYRCLRCKALVEDANAHAATHRTPIREQDGFQLLETREIALEYHDRQSLGWSGPGWYGPREEPCDGDTDTVWRHVDVLRADAEEKLAEAQAEITRLASLRP